MLSSLGKKRIVILSILLIVNGILAYSIFMSLQPGILKQERALRNVRVEVSERQQELEALLQQSEILDQQKDAFEKLKQSGFFSVQDAGTTVKIFEILEKTAEVKAKAIIDARRFKEDEDAAKSGRLLMESPVSIEISARNDVDIYKYIYLLENYFPGHLTINEIEMTRERNVDGAVLRSIVSGGSPTLVKANIKLTWRTMVKQELRNNL